MPRLAKPWVSLGGGRADYTYYYRSNIDTPFIQQNVYQHQLNVGMGLTVGSLLPIQVNAQFRRSNSLLFRNINDLQVELDLPALQRKLYAGVADAVARSAAQLKDTLAGILAHAKGLEYVAALDRFNQQFSTQRLAEVQELLQVPSLRWDNRLPDSLAQRKSDSLKQAALLFMEQYQLARGKVAWLKGKADSLQEIYNRSLALANRVKAAAQNGIGSREALQQLGGMDGIGQKAMALVPPRLRWILGLRKLSVGRSPVNHTELTARNLMLNGFNVEYNSWYYVAASAGLINYRFRDFVIQNPNRPRQYFVMGRMGIGQIEKDYLILSVFKGQKQVFASGVVNGLYPVVTTGISLEGRWQWGRFGHLKMEVATSVAPDFTKLPVKSNRLNLRDREDKAFAVSSQMAFPKSQTKLDLFFRYMGANFQSFSNFQNNAGITAWGIRAEQHFFKRALRFTASIKANDFANPLIPQRYRSNTVFKTAQLVFRKRKWPVLSAGIMPMSQLTDVGGVVYENQFMAVHASLYHHYRIGDAKGATSMVFTQFRNNQADTGFLYFNAANLFVNQLVYFSRFTATVNVTYSTNRGYALTVLDENIEVPIRKLASVMLGLKVNNLNSQFTKAGMYGSLRFRLLRRASISMSFEDGYMPGLNRSLVKNSMASIQLSKLF
jgi:hypothetical protein